MNKLKEILSALGLPVGLAIVLSGVTLMFGIDIEQVSAVAGALLGVSMLIALMIDVLKWAGVINDGNAGRWSAGVNLIMLVCVAVATRWYPQFDLYSIDAQIMQFVKVYGLVFAYVIQIVTSKRMHELMVNGLALSLFSKSKTREAMLKQGSTAATVYPRRVA